MKSTLVSCNVNPDLDGYASAIAYTEFLQKTGRYAVPGIFGIPDDEVQFILKHLEMLPPQGEMNPVLYDDVVLVDASIVSGIDRRIEPDKVSEIIDHRLVNDAKKFPKARVQIEQVGAAATLIAEKFAQEKISLSSYSTPLLYTAIVSNTLNFQSDVTTDRDRAMAEWLRSFSGIPDTLVREMFLAKSHMDNEQLEHKLRTKFAFFKFNDESIGVSQLELIGAELLVKNRRAEILSVLTQLQQEMNLKIYFAMLVGLEEQQNIFVTPDHYSQKILSAILDITFADGVAVLPKLMMRKELIPLIQKQFSK